MRFILDRLKNYGCCCLNCGSFLTVEGLLCLSCRESLAYLRASESNPKQPIRLKSLYYWYPGQSDLLSKLVLNLKGSKAKNAWQYYARCFARMNITENYNQPLCIVPAPSGTDDLEDHAFLWAKALATSVGAQFFPCLRKVSTGHQRGAQRGERALVDLEAVEISSFQPRITADTLFIFADDVFTTGATARAAHKALGFPKNFEVWTLVHRGLSCGASSDLL